MRAFSRRTLRSMTSGRSIGSHWYAVPGFGTSGFTLPMISPMRPRGRPCLNIRSRICTVKSRMATRSSSSSVAGQS